MARPLLLASMVPEAMASEWEAAGGKEVAETPSPPAVICDKRALRAFTSNRPAMGRQSIPNT